MTALDLAQALLTPDVLLPGDVIAVVDRDGNPRRYPTAVVPAYEYAEVSE